MKPFREHIRPDPASSLCLLDRRLPAGIPFEWHHHPEFELTLTLNSGGQRFVGDHAGAYEDGDLVLLGPNLPHTWCSQQRTAPGPHVALVIWFHPEWASRLTRELAEFKEVRRLLARAGRGLHFGREGGAAVRARFESLFTDGPVGRLMTFLGILLDLSKCPAVPLASRPPAASASRETGERLDRVLAHLHASYARPVSLAEVADVACLSASGLHRMFVRQTGQTISGYLARRRIGDACARLAGTEDPVAWIAEAVGYTSLANFNRQFRALAGVSPREYRSRFREPDPERHRSRRAARNARIG